MNVTTLYNRIEYDIAQRLAQGDGAASLALHYPATLTPSEKLSCALLCTGSVSKVATFSYGIEIVLNWNLKGARG